MALSSLVHGTSESFRLVALYRHSRPQSTAKVWKDFKLLYDLVGHQQAVWAVLAIDGGQFLTGQLLLSMPTSVTLTEERRRLGG